MATTEPQKWSATLGASADVNALPATTPSGSGRASTSGLFPPVTQLPLDQGGIAPERGDFNALFKYLGEYIYYAMQGGVYTYVTTYDYTAGNFVLHEGSLYLCIAANGPGSAVKYPTDAAYWRRLALISDMPTVGNGTITVQASGTPVGSFTVNQGGNSTINIPEATDSAFGVVKTEEHGAVGVQGAEAGKPPLPCRHGAGNELVDAVHLLGGGGHRLDDEMVHSCGGLSIQQGLHRAIVHRGDAIEGIGAPHRLMGNGGGIYVAVGVHHFILSDHGVSPALIHSSASSRILYLRILPAAFMGNVSTKRMYRGTLCRAIWAAI